MEKIICLWDCDLYNKEILVSVSFPSTELLKLLELPVVRERNVTSLRGLRSLCFHKWQLSRKRPSTDGCHWVALKQRGYTMSQGKRLSGRLWRPSWQVHSQKKKSLYLLFFKKEKYKKYKLKQPIISPSR